MNHAKINVVLAECAKLYHDEASELPTMEVVYEHMTECQRATATSMLMGKGLPTLRGSFVRMIALTLRAVELVDSMIEKGGA